MNNLLKAAARKHALANGIATAAWTDNDFGAYVAEHGITERDNLRKGNHSKAHAAEKKVEEKAEIKSVAKPTGKVESAIAELIAATAGKADLDEARVIELIGEYSKAPVRVTVDVTENDKVIVTRDGAHKEYANVLAHIAAGVDLAVVGPAGSGKSTIFKHVAEDLGLDYYIVSSPQQESKIMGYNDAHGNYVRTPMRDAYEHGGLIVVEEFDGSNAKALLACNNLVANDSADFPDGMIQKHEKCIVVMAGNTFGTGASRQYVGRTQIDAATLDRFAFLEVGYDEVLERDIALAFNADASHWVDDVQAFRRKVDAAGIRHVVSPRASIMGAKLLKQGLPEDVIVKTVLHKGMTADQIKQVSR